MKNIFSHTYLDSLNHMYIMRKLLLFTMISSAALAFQACSADDITSTTDHIDGSSSQTDPGLQWSASSAKAYLGVDNTFPSLLNEYGVPVNYSSSNEAVATIASDGTVTLVAEGSVTISATSEETDSYSAGSAYYTLAVYKTTATLSWSESEVSVVVGSEFSQPVLSNPYSLDVTFASSDESVATIDEDGVVSVISNGTTVITASAAESDYFEAASASYTLNVSKNSDGISWTKSTCTVTIGASDNEFPSLNNPGSQSITYSSTSTSVATIDSDGVITLVSAGETTIVAKSAATDDYEAATAQYVLTVQEEGSNLISAGLAWAATSYTATVGGTFSSPVLTNPYGLSVEYSSSDEGVATVSSSGTVTILSAGSTVITATSEATDTYLSGSASYTLTVSLADAGLAWDKDIYNFTYGEDFTQPSLTNSHGLSVSYSSSDENVFTVDASGNVSLVSAGTAYLYAAFEGDDTYASSTAYCTVKVSKGTPAVEWSASTCSVDLDDNSTWNFPSLSLSPGTLSVTYSSSSTSVATVSASGTPTPVAAGSTTITATTAATDQYKSASATYILSVTSTSDDGAVETSFASSGTGDDDDIANTTFSRLVTVTYSTSGTATVTGCSAVSDVMSVSVSGNGVTITYTGSENVVYKLTGSTGTSSSTYGYFKLYSSKKQAIWLDGVSITNYYGSAINNQSGKRTFVYVSGTNTLADGSSATYSATGDEDMKGVFFSEGQLIFSGPSSGTNKLTVTANNATGKSGIVSDDYVRFAANATVSVTAGSSAGHGVKGNEYVQISDGTLGITTKAAMKKGITSDDYVLVEGGTTTITVTGGSAYDDDDAEYKGSAGIKADNYFAMTGGTVTITNSGTGGKGVRAGTYDYNSGSLSDSYMTGGTLNVSTTGSEYTTGDITCKAIKIGYKEKSGNSYKYGGNFLVSGGDIVATCSKSETIEVKGALTISGGSVYAYSTGDDAINSQGQLTVNDGYVFGQSSANDAIDTNCDFVINGGYVCGITTAGSPEVALDANTEERYKLYINGGYVVAYGGLESGYSASVSVYSMTVKANGWNALYTSSYACAFYNPTSYTSFVVAGNSLTKGYTGVTVSSSNYKCNSRWATSASGGSVATLSSYSSGPGNGGPGNGGPGFGRH